MAPLHSVATCIGTTAAAAASRLSLRATRSACRSSSVATASTGITSTDQEQRKRVATTSTSTSCPLAQARHCQASSLCIPAVRLYSASIPAYAQRRGKFGTKRSEGGSGSRSSGGGGGGGGGGNSKTQKRNARRKKKRSAIRAEKRRMRGGGGKSRGRSSGGSMALLPGDSDASSVFSSDNDFQYDYDSDDDDDDAYSYRRDGGRKLYYYQINDVDEPSGSSGWTTEVPSAIRARMQSDPTYFHGMDGMAEQWTPPSRTPPSKDPRVQRVLRDVLQRQEARRRKQAQQARGDDNEVSGWSGSVVIRVPKKNGKTAGSDNGAVGGGKDIRLVSEDVLSTRIDTALSETSTKQIDSSDASASAATATADPPKKRRTAYILYSMAKRAEVKQAKPDASPRDIIKIISAEWRAIGDEEKKIWDEKAAADKIRYVEEMEAYKSAESGQ